LSASISQLIEELQPYAYDLVRAAGAAGLQPRVTSTRRSTQEQTRLYRRYLAGLNPFPVAPPGTSAHEFGFAFDMVVSPMDALADVGAYWKEQGGVWGGEFNDPVHFEYPGFSKPAVADDRGVLETTFDTVADWVDSLPWWVQLVLPAWTVTSKKRANPDTIAQILKDAGVS